MLINFMIKAVIFDLWGTLFYEDINPHPFVEFSRKLGKNIEYGYKNEEEYQFIKKFERHFMTKPYEDVRIPIKSFLKELKIEATDGLIEDLNQILSKTGPFQKPYPETFKVLRELKHKEYRLGLISNCMYYGFKQLEQKFDLKEFFDATYMSFKTKILKPNPEIFRLMIDELRVNKKETAMVGDSIKDDVQAAENFGIKGILIDRQNKHPECKIRITTLEELNKFI